jgi:hypothetical protein
MPYFVRAAGTFHADTERSRTLRPGWVPVRAERCRRPEQSRASGLPLGILAAANAFPLFERTLEVLYSHQRRLLRVPASHRALRPGWVPVRAERCRRPEQSRASGLPLGATRGLGEQHQVVDGARIKLSNETYLSLLRILAAANAFPLDDLVLLLDQRDGEVVPAQVRLRQDHATPRADERRERLPAL